MYIKSLIRWTIKIMRNLKIAGGFVFIFWLVGLFLTYSNSLFWFLYLIVSSIALILAAILLYQTEFKKIYQYADKEFTKLKVKPAERISYDEDEEYYEVLDNQKRRKKRRKRRTSTYLETTMREKKNQRTLWLF